MCFMVSKALCIYYYSIWKSIQGHFPTGTFLGLLLCFLHSSYNIPAFIGSCITQGMNSDSLHIASITGADLGIVSGGGQGGLKVTYVA